MADYLLDTNILLRASDPQSEQYAVADEVDGITIIHPQEVIEQTD